MHVSFPDMHCCPEDKIMFCRDVLISLLAVEALKFAKLRKHWSIKSDHMTYGYLKVSLLM